MKSRKIEIMDETHAGLSDYAKRNGTRFDKLCGKILDLAWVMMAGRGMASGCNDLAQLIEDAMKQANMHGPALDDTPPEESAISERGFQEMHQPDTDPSAIAAESWLAENDPER